jgi:hypothetical protein
VELTSLGRYFGTDDCLCCNQSPNDDGNPPYTMTDVLQKIIAKSTMHQITLLVWLAVYGVALILT